MPVATLITCPSESEGLIRWAMLFALAQENVRLVVFHPEAVSESDLNGFVESWKNEGHHVVPELRYHQLAKNTKESDLLKLFDEIGPDLLVLGQNRSDDSTLDLRQLGRDLFDHAHCDTIAIRLGSRKLEECDSVLIPSSGGPHSRVALRLGSRVANRFDGTISPLFIEPEIGEAEGKAVGMRVLERVLDEAGLDRSDTDHIQPQVVVSNNVLRGMRIAAEEKSYDLILIGASNSTTVKRKLFGSVPDRLLDGEEAVTVAVIRRRRSLQHRLRQRLERFMTLRIPQLSRDERISLFDRLQVNSRWNFDFLSLMVLATGIASLGLIQDSAAVVIGAMLVAPLMTPLLGSGLALVQGNLPLMRTCLRAIVLGFLAALVVGAFMGLAAPLSTLTNELASRGGPNLLDFGVATLAGIAASYCIGRPNLSSALAGVAIAAALVPPIATVGISLALQEWTNASGAALLFATNVVGIILSSALTFFANGVRGQGVGMGTLWVRRTLICLVVAVVILLVPLTSVLISHDKISREELRGAMTSVLEEDSIGVSHVEVSRVSRSGDTVNVFYRIIADAQPDQLTVNKVAKLIEKQPGVSQVSVEMVTDLRIRSAEPEKK